MDVGEQEFVPVVRRERESGSLVMAIVPSEPDAGAFLGGDPQGTCPRGSYSQAPQLARGPDA